MVARCICATCMVESDMHRQRLELCIRVAEALEGGDGEEAAAGAAATALNVSRDGSLVAVGFSNGHLGLLAMEAGDRKKLRLCSAAETGGPGSS